MGPEGFKGGRIDAGEFSWYCVIPSNAASERTVLASRAVAVRMQP
jgi:hypothetical protein